jgi:hypothetical protein
VHRSRNQSECVKPQPFAVTVYEKASGAFYVLLPGRFINFRECKPGDMRQVVMDQMVDIVEDQLGGAQSLIGRDLVAHC